MGRRRAAALAALLCWAAAARADDFTRSLSGLREAVLAARGVLDYRLGWDAKRERYVCKDAQGTAGFNSISLSQLLKDKQGQCAWLYAKSLKFQDLTGATLRGAGLGAAKLQYADLVGADLFAADIRKAWMHQADLSGADLRLANLREANLFQADLPGADLRGADLTGADLTGADLKQARYDKKTLLPFDDQAAAERGMLKVDE